MPRHKKSPPEEPTGAAPLGESPFAPEPGSSVELPDGAELTVKKSYPSGANEALVVDKKGWIFRVYANKDDGKREKKYPQRVCNPLRVKAVVKNPGQQSDQEVELSFDGTGYPPYSVEGELFAEKAEGFVKKFNEKSLEKTGDGLWKNFGYKLRLNKQVFFEYQDLAYKTKQIDHLCERDFKVVYK